VSHPQVAVFARMADGNAAPVRSVAGQNTLISRSTHGIAYDEAHDLFLIPNMYGQAIMFFRGDAAGDVAPVRIIRGPKTQLKNPDHLAFDGLHNEVFIPQGDKILSYSGSADGDVAPLRVLQGPDTQLTGGSVGVDPLNNLLIAVANDRELGQGRTKLLIFDRTANGNVKPKGVIRGPQSELIGTQAPFAVYPPKKLLLIGMYGPGPLGTEDSYIGVWDYGKYGDTPPLWKFGGPHGIIRQPRGVTLDVAHKSVIVTDKRVNAVMTWYFPEMF
jgi:hypothetical protein